MQLSKVSISEIKLIGDPPVGRMKINCDLSRDLAVQMKWDCIYDGDPSKNVVTNGWDRLPLKGEILIASIKMKPSSKRGTSIEMSASYIKGFMAHRLQGKADDPPEIYLSATVYSSDGNFEQLAGPYMRGLGRGTSILTLNEAQIQLFSGEAENADEPDDEEIDATPEE